MLLLLLLLLHWLLSLTLLLTLLLPGDCCWPTQWRVACSACP
jgi:hypothetical protein